MKFSCPPVVRKGLSSDRILTMPRTRESLYARYQWYARVSFRSKKYFRSVGRAVLATLVPSGLHPSRPPLNPLPNPRRAPPLPHSPHPSSSRSTTVFALLTSASLLKFAFEFISRAFDLSDGAHVWVPRAFLFPYKAVRFRRGRAFEGLWRAGGSFVRSCSRSVRRGFLGVHRSRAFPSSFPLPGLPFSQSRSGRSGFPRCETYYRNRLYRTRSTTVAHDFHCRRRFSGQVLQFGSVHVAVVGRDLGDRENCGGRGESWVEAGFRFSERELCFG